MGCSMWSMCGLNTQWWLQMKSLCESLYSHVFLQQHVSSIKLWVLIEQLKAVTFTMVHWWCPNAHTSLCIPHFTFLQGWKWFSSASDMLSKKIRITFHWIRRAGVLEVGLFCCDLLVHGVLDVLLQPSDLWVQAHLSLVLQPGTDRLKKPNKHKLLSGVIYCEMKGWIMQNE